MRHRVTSGIIPTMKQKDNNNSFLFCVVSTTPSDTNFSGLKCEGNCKE